jgi:hypothetical protein
MEESPRGTISRVLRVTALALAILCAGCSGRFAGPRLLATVGATTVAGGSVMWAGGEGFGLDAGKESPALVSAGFVTVVAGLCAIVVAGGWMAASVACDNDPDCHEEEQCREVPAPAGFTPYKQCVPR